MIRNYFFTALRNLWKNKFYSSINISGLSIGLAVGIMILLWVQDELSYDKFHEQAKNIYKVNSHVGSGEGAKVWTGSPSPVALFSKSEIPEVENSVRIRDNWEMSLFKYGNNKFIIPGTAFVDNSFFSIFNFKFIKGTGKKPFKDANSVILTKSTANKFFGDADPIGKVIVADNKENFSVTGVMEDFPENSSIRYNMLFPIANYAKKFGGNGDWKTIDEDMGNFTYNIFLQLKPGADPKAAADKVSILYSRKRNEDEKTGRFSLQPLKNFHLYAADGSAGDMQTVKTFLMVAILILLIACINYVNLSTARSMLRSKEVSVRKIIGANRAHLFMQFIFESGLLFAVGSVIAIFIVKLLFPFYNEISGKKLVFSLADSSMWMVILCAILGSLVVASIYPALLLSSFKPIEALKGKLSFGAGNIQFRKVLVVVQFVFSVTLIISTIVIGMQLKYLREKNLGYEKEHVFSFGIRDEMYSHYATVKNELMKMPGIVDVSTADANITAITSSTSDTEWEGKPEGSTFIIHPSGIDENYIPLFKMQMADGRNFRGGKGDSLNVILNETAVKDAGIVNPVGKRFKLWDTDAMIIGVVKDFNYASLKTRIEPAIFYYQPANYRVFIKTTGREANKAIASVEKIWKQYSPDYPFSYSFVDEDYDALYKTEQRTGTLFNLFAIVAILISCLGLFGLAAYTAQVKTKEIGIRKVLGATVSNIIQLLAKDFISLVFISLLIAVPIGWWAMSSWLQDFVYRINMSWWIFLIAGVAAILIAVITVSMQAIKAALANPVRSLKEE
jgi:putative ABC transport system permease protein